MINHTHFPDTDFTSSQVKRSKRSTHDNEIRYTSAYPGNFPNQERASQDETQLTLETLVVVDHRMIKAHGKHHITTYVLTLMHMVAKMFKDESIGPMPIKIKLVALIFLEHDEVGDES